VDESNSTIRLLIAARDSHVTDVYDEVFDEVAARIQSAGTVGKADIGALLFWKRLRADTRWARSLNQLPDSAVRAATGEAVRAAADTTTTTPEAAATARRALRSLPGFTTGDALASAVIAASAPDRMAVYDRRAHTALRDLVGRDIGHQAGRYSRYMTEVGTLLDAVRAMRPQWTARDIDLALYWAGGKA
jgi:hypothetical protein